MHDTVIRYPTGGRVESIVLLLWAPWAAPSRPSLTVARELARKHRGSVEVIALDIAEEVMALPHGVEIRTASPGPHLTGEIPSDRLIDMLRVSILPTWIRLERPPARIAAGDTSGWCEVARCEGARPKHEIEAMIVSPAVTPTTMPDGSEGTRNLGSSRPTRAVGS